MRLTTTTLAFSALLGAASSQTVRADTLEAIRELPAGSVEDADGGVLVLQANFSKRYQTPKGHVADFVSGRIDSRGKFEFTHGRAAARIK